MSAVLIAPLAPTTEPEAMRPGQKWRLDIKKPPVRLPCDDCKLPVLIQGDNLKEYRFLVSEAGRPWIYCPGCAEKRDVR